MCGPHTAIEDIIRNNLAKNQAFSG